MSVPMERITIQTLLGICFWDPAIRQPIGQGLRVNAQLLSTDRAQRVGRLVTGVATANHVYAFFGLRAEEHPAADETLWEHVPPDRFAVIDVTDPAARYLPLSFLVRTPFRGPFRGEGDWLSRSLQLPVTAPAAAPGVYLWSAAGRTTPAGLTTLHGQIAVGVAADPPPAAFALVQVHNVEGALFAVGMTDITGKLTLPLPYPAIPDPPDSAPYPSLDRQRFDLTVTVHYQPSAQTPLPQSTTPDLAALLGQAAAQVAILYDPTVAGAAAYTFAPELAIQLPYGPPFVLRTPIQGGTRGQPFLRIQPAA